MNWSGVKFSTLPTVPAHTDAYRLHMPDRSGGQKNKLGKSFVSEGLIRSTGLNLVSETSETISGRAKIRVATPPLPPRKPSAVAVLAQTEVVDTLSHPRTELERVTQTLWFQPDNPSVTTQDIRAHVNEISSTEPGFMPITRELMRHNIPVAQLIDAMTDHPTLTRRYIEDQLTQQGMPSPNKWLRSVDGSAVVHTRLGLNRHGLERLDGSGVKVWVLEPQDNFHGDSVAAVVNDKKYGLAPGATVVKKHAFTAHELEHHGEKAKDGLYRDVQASVRRLTAKLDAHSFSNARALQDQWAAELAPLVSKHMDATYEKIIQHIKEFTASEAQVLNLSLDRNLFWTLATLEDALYTALESSPALAGALFPDVPAASTYRLRNRVVSLAVSVLALELNSPTWRAYADATSMAADKGKIIVVAASNDQGKVRHFVKTTGTDFPNALMLNAYGMSDHVIVAGASKTNGTPLDISDDVVAEFSSHGNDRYGVTTTTQGEGVAVPYPLFVAMGGQNSGTSLSAPAIAGLAALYK